MQYTLSQVRETVGLSVETYRHWRRVLPPLAAKVGRAPCFSIGDLIAASVIHRLTETAGVRVGHLSDLSRGIFDLCNHSSWAALIGKALVIDLEQRACRLDHGPGSGKQADLLLTCHLDPVLSHLRDALLRGSADKDQTELLFPPIRVPTSKERRPACS